MRCPLRICLQCASPSCCASGARRTRWYDYVTTTKIKYKCGRRRYQSWGCLRTRNRTCRRSAQRIVGQYRSKGRGRQSTCRSTCSRSRTRSLCCKTKNRSGDNSAQCPRSSHCGAYVNTGKGKGGGGTKICARRRVEIVWAQIHVARYRHTPDLISTKFIESTVRSPAAGHEQNHRHSEDELTNVVCM